MNTSSSSTKTVSISRWVARIFGTILVLIVLSLFIPVFIQKGGNINVNHPGQYFMMISFGLAQFGILIAWRREGLGGGLTVFGIIVVLVTEIGLITPPVGLNLYVINGIVPDVSLPTILKGALPFMLCMVLGIVLLCIFPEIATWLPTYLMGPAI